MIQKFITHASLTCSDVRCYEHRLSNTGTHSYWHLHRGGGDGSCVHCILLYLSHERALRDEDHDIHHGVHTHDESDEEEESSESDEEDPDLEMGSASEIRSPVNVNVAKDILSGTLRKDQSAKMPNLMRTAMANITADLKKGEKGYNLRAAVTAASSAASAPKKSALNVNFASPQNSVLEKQLVMAEKREKDSAMAAIAEQNEAVKAQENETIAKRRKERGKQN